ncbi:MAG: ankyrin repeat domain-containing protein [Gemmatimonas sp.]
MKILFWLLIAVDVLALGLFFVLGLAAATSTRTSPFAVATSLPFLVPTILLVLAVALFTRSGSTVGRIAGLLIAASPAIIIFVTRGMTQREIAVNSDSGGNIAFFREGPLRELADAIRAGDTTRVAQLLPTVDVNSKGFQDITPLMLALRELDKSPNGTAVVRQIVSAGANPNLGEGDLPLIVAIQQSQHAGAEPVAILLKAGANPNTQDQFGRPVYFQGTGITVPIDVLKALLDGGADLKVTGKDGRPVVFDAVNTNNWPAVLLLLERGIDYKSARSLGGESLTDMVEGRARLFENGMGGSPGDTAALAKVREFLKTH